MKESELVIGSFYWLNVLGTGLVPRSVMAKITVINNNEDMTTYSAKIIDPVNGKMSEIKSCNAWDFTKPINRDKVSEVIEDIRNKLKQFTKS